MKRLTHTQNHIKYLFIVLIIIMITMEWYDYNYNWSTTCLFFNNLIYSVRDRYLSNPNILSKSDSFKIILTRLFVNLLLILSLVFLILFTFFIFLLIGFLIINRIILNIMYDDKYNTIHNINQASSMTTL